MTPFPEVRFEVLLPDGGITAGRTASGILVVSAEEAVPRADGIDLELVSTITYRRPRLSEEVLHRARRRVALPAGIVAGVHRFPFTLDAPASLPPSFHDPYVTIRHAVRIRMDVAWARDPAVDAFPKLILPPREGERTPTSIRLPLELQDAEIELGLDSTVLVQGAPILGFLRLHRGSLEPFEALELSLVSELTSAVAGKWTRSHASILVTNTQLQRGKPVLFELPGAGLPSFTSDVLVHALELGINPHGDFVSFRPRSTLVPLEVLPHGSVIEGSRELRRAARLAAATGLREGKGAILAEGEPSGLRLRIRIHDGAIEAELACPQLSPGTDLFTTLLPAPRKGILLRPAHRLLVMRSPHASERIEDLVDLARYAIDHAATLAQAIQALPFPTGFTEELADAWRACAHATGAFLVPPTPSLEGLLFRRLLPTQGERIFTASIGTVWTGGVPRDRVTLDLGLARLPEPAMVLLANNVFPDKLAAVRATFEALHASANGALLVLEGATRSDDPRKVLPAIEAVIDWVMRERGEDRSGSPYR